MGIIGWDVIYNKYNSSLVDSMREILKNYGINDYWIDMESGPAPEIINVPYTTEKDADAAFSILVEIGKQITRYHFDYMLSCGLYSLEDAHNHAVLLIEHTYNDITQYVKGHCHVVNDIPYLE